jgi:aryl-phospho-beta-D-glucosidase BglC (GH1 family)
MSAAPSYLHTAGSGFVDHRGQPIRLRGIAVGGWLSMENFITGYPANESLMRAAVRSVLGPERYELFFDRLIASFFTADDAKLIADAGLNAVRIAISYRRLEDDTRPFEVPESGFRDLDRAIALCAEQGMYTIIDMHSLPGYQNHHWHCDNPTHLPMLWSHPHFQDRAVHLWEVLADRYKDNPWVAGYNPVNEPADESRQVIGPFYQRLMAAIRAIDPHHTLFLDGNTYSTEFGFFGDPQPNTVYVCHDYVPSGLGYGGPYPGSTKGVWYDREVVEQKFLQRSEFSRQTGTPVWVGEFGPVYTGDPAIDAQRQQILADQLEIYRRHHASWSLWTYKDIGRQGLATVRPDSAYLQRFGGFVAKKERLAADAWGSDGEGPREVTAPFQDLIAREFPDFDPYPWGRWDWVRTLLLTITIAQPLVQEYAQLFGGLDDDELLALADSFALRHCAVRESLHRQLREDAA